MILNYARCRETLPSNRRKPSSPSNLDKGSMGACVDVMPGIGAKNTFRRSNFAFDRSGNRRQGKSVSEIGGPLLLCYNMQKYFLRTSFSCTTGEGTKSSRISLSLCTTAGHSCPCFSESSRSQLMHTPIPVGAALSVKVKGAGANSRSESGCRERVAGKPRKEPTGSSGTPETTGDVGRQSRVNLRRVES